MLSQLPTARRQARERILQRHHANYLSVARIKKPQDPKLIDALSDAINPLKIFNVDFISRVWGGFGASLFSEL